MTASLIITEAHARKVLELVSHGLVAGLGNPEPGQACVEAVVSMALGLPHGDNPPCVGAAVRALKIRLNDSAWSSNAARANGMRRLAVAQLGSDVIDQKEFAKRVAELAIRKSVPEALRAAAKIRKSDKQRAALLDAATRCEKEGTRDAATAAYAATTAAYAATTAAATATAAAAAAAYAAAAYAAASAANADKSLADFAEGVVQILVAMGAPGCQWLHLTEDPAP